MCSLSLELATQGETTVLHQPTIPTSSNSDARGEYANQMGSVDGIRSVQKTEAWEANPFDGPDPANAAGADIQ